jgi:hypothetical protein
MDTKISTLYMAMIFGAAIVIGLTMIQADLFGNYGVTSPDLSYLNVSQGISDRAADLRDTLNRDISSNNPLDMLLAGVYNSLSILFGIGDLYATFLTNIGSALSIPAPFIGLGIAAIFVIVLFGIFTIITNREV